MARLCRFGLHKAVPSDVWNAGLFFSRCARCGCDMIRRPEQKWRPVPPHQHVVWKQATERSVAFIVPRNAGRETLPRLLDDMGLFARPQRGFPRLERQQPAAQVEIDAQAKPRPLGG